MVNADKIDGATLQLIHEENQWAEFGITTKSDILKLTVALKKIKWRG